MLRRIFIIFGYVGFVLALIVFTAALVAYGKDYSYDFATHKVIQNGHVIIATVPNGATITADGKQLKQTTPYQAAYKVGVHTFSLTKDGFWPWQKMLKVVAGRVSLADYVTLVPKQPAQTVFDSRTAITAQAMSRDGRHLVYITGGTDPAVVTLDVGSKKLVKLYVPKAATATDPAEVLQSVTWSSDASHVLIVSTIGAQPVHRLAAASGGEPVNLTAVYGFNLTGLSFSGSNWKQLYWISPDGLRRLDVDAQTVTGVLADKVSQFWTEPDRVLYVQQTELGRSLWSMDGHGKRQELIPALTESDVYSVAEARYNGTDELVVVPAKTGVATLYSDIFSDTPESKVIARDVTGASFSPKGTFLELDSPVATRVYDLEQSAVQQSFVLYTFSAHTGVSTWFDESHLLTSRDGELSFGDYDGTNSVDLGKGYGGFPAYVSGDGRSVVMFQPSATGVRVQGELIKP